MNEAEFVNGLIVKAPRDGAPDFVKGSISIKIGELIEWLNDRDGEWVNIDLKEARSGKWYAAVNNYKKEESRSGGRSPSPSRQAVQKSQPMDDFADDDIPW